jgi:ribose transport system ATP-binding protein
MLLARPRPQDCPVVVLEAPTVGVDVAASLEIHQRVIDLAAEGRAVLLSSDDLPEIERLADRVVVLVRGKTFIEWERSDLSHAALLEALGSSGSAETVAGQGIQA